MSLTEAMRDVCTFPLDMLAVLCMDAMEVEKKCRDAVKLFRPGIAVVSPTAMAQSQAVRILPLKSHPRSLGQ